MLTLERLKVGYFVYRVSLPGLALASLFFVPFHPPIWTLDISDTIWFFLGCAGFGAIAWYWVYVTEVLRFPTSTAEALRVIFSVPAQLFIATLFSPSPFLVIFISAFFVEFVGSLWGLLLTVFSTMKKDPNWSAATVLVTIAIAGVGFSFFFLTSTVDLFWQNIVGLLTSVLTLALQTFRLMRSPNHVSSFENAGYILIGVAAFLFLPLVAWAVYSLM